nr:hypothetical protein [Prevotella sp.]
MPGKRIRGKLLIVFFSKLVKIIFITAIYSLQVAKLAKNPEKKERFSIFFANFAVKYKKGIENGKEKNIRQN